MAASGQQRRPPESGSTPRPPYSVRLGRCGSSTAPVPESNLTSGIVGPASVSVCSAGVTALRPAVAEHRRRLPTGTRCTLSANSRRRANRRPRPQAAAPGDPDRNRREAPAALKHPGSSASDGGHDRANGRLTGAASGSGNTAQPRPGDRTEHPRSEHGVEKRVREKPEATPRTPPVFWPNGRSCVTPIGRGRSRLIIPCWGRGTRWDTRSAGGVAARGPRLGHRSSAGSGVPLWGRRPAAGFLGPLAAVADADGDRHAFGRRGHRVFSARRVGRWPRSRTRRGRPASAGSAGSGARSHGPARAGPCACRRPATRTGSARAARRGPRTGGSMLGLRPRGRSGRRWRASGPRPARTLTQAGAAVWSDRRLSPSVCSTLKT